MTEIEAAELIVEQNGDCYEPLNISCCDCPTYRIQVEKGFDCCVDLWYGHDNDKQKVWFQNWLKENNQSECKVIVNDNIKEKLDKIIKILEDIKNEN